jgi:hypothetical protein
MEGRTDGTVSQHRVRRNILLEYSQGRADMYIFRHTDMLKAFDDTLMSKSMYIRNKNMIITASRGRRVKVSIH